MALIELNFGGDSTDDDSDSVEIPIDDDESSSGSTGRSLLGLLLLVALVAAAGYLVYRRASSGDGEEFADIAFEDEAAEAEAETEEVDE